jgi:hypothetical protein
MGPTHDGTPLLQQTMMGYSIEGFPMTPNGEGRIDLLLQGDIVRRLVLHQPQPYCGRRTLRPIKLNNHSTVVGQ